MPTEHVRKQTVDVEFAGPIDEIRASTYLEYNAVLHFAGVRPGNTFTTPDIADEFDSIPQASKAVLAMAHCGLVHKTGGLSRRHWPIWKRRAGNLRGL